MLISLAQFALAMMAAVVTVMGAVIGMDTIPLSLGAMADAERAFARLAAETTLQAAFLKYFADESISFNPDPGPARDRLRRQPDAFPKDMRITWEPRLGDVSASGDLGYLTGPAETTMPGQPVRHGNYFSVWKKQADGTYRVILDVGLGLAAKAEFAPGLIRSAAVATYKGADTKAAAEAGLLAADTTLAAAIAAKGAAAAYGEVLHSSARVHRAGSPPMASRDAAVLWMRERVKAMTITPMKSEVAASRNLGYTWGAFTMTPATGAGVKGYYVRVWTRGADGRWWIAADAEDGRRLAAD